MGETQGHGHQEGHGHAQGSKYGMVIDLDKCTGCGACMVACMAENNVPTKPDETNKLDTITWMRVFKLSNGKAFPEAETCYLPRPCMHCGGKHDAGHSPCVSVCPATATDYSYKTGIVSQIYTRCFGCRYCMGACPYKARYFNWWDPKFPADMKEYLSPDVSVRMRGIVEKCSFCFHRYQRAMDRAFYEGRELEEHEYQTACTQACPAGAITFGDLNNERHMVHKVVNDKHEGHAVLQGRKPFRLLEELDTNPKVYYLSARDWVVKAGNASLRETKPATKKPSGGHH
ncbi:menaquinone reductase iron-sulfur cluster-binding subunit QrcC [Desulfatibacillum aliphaticivorans]|uniref:menaquinone reductase iron-sulfur cluster-binding subunit QrcC n=1 Tax=Desulfatibacillum aliphaticivorans TaxID=218208 RepID=UPI000412CA3C|nr:menaquinone reductase iron-sulfur cluster-binding subunit QrcC [Desulfatibacillum aliphaticivorans]